MDCFRQLLHLPTVRACSFITKNSCEAASDSVSRHWKFLIGCHLSKWRIRPEKLYCREKHNRLNIRYIQNYYFFLKKSIYFSQKKYILFARKVYIFCLESIMFLPERYIPFL